MAGRKNGDRLGVFIVAALFAGSMICGSIGWKQYVGDSMPLTWTDIAYRMMTLFTVNASFEEPNVPLLLDISRFLSPLTLAGTVIVLTLSYFKVGLTALVVRAVYRDHAVFYGCNPRSLLIAADIVSKRRVVFLLDEPDESMMDDVAGIGAVALSGHHSLSSAFRRSALARASWLFVMPSSDIDSQSISRAAEAFLSLIPNRERPTVFVEYGDDFALRVARAQSEARSAKKSEPIDYVDVQPFNLELILAREIVTRYQPSFASLDRRFHTAIFGFDNPGQMLAVEVAQMFHFADLTPPRLTIIDRGIAAKWGEFILRHPSFERVADVTVIEASEWASRPDTGVPDLAFISFTDSALAFDTGRMLRQQTRIVAQQNASGKTRETNIVVIPPIGSSDSFPSAECCADFLEVNGIALINTDEVLNGMDIINRNESCDSLAKGVHYSWMAKPGEPWIGAVIDREWSMLSDTLRDSNRYAARHLLVKLRYLGRKAIPASECAGETEFAFSSVDGERLETLGRLEHNRWVAEKYLAGYLPIACDDPETYRTNKKYFLLHCNIVPWESLSRDDQLKDMNALYYANEIVRAAGLRLVKVNG